MIFYEPVHFNINIFLLDNFVKLPNRTKLNLIRIKHHIGKRYFIFLTEIHE